MAVVTTTVFPAAKANGGVGTALCPPTSGLSEPPVISTTAPTISASATTPPAIRYAGLMMRDVGA